MKRILLSAALVAPSHPTVQRAPKRDDGSINTLNVAIAAGVMTVLVVYAIRRRSL